MGTINFYVTLYRLNLFKNGTKNNGTDNRQAMPLSTFFQNNGIKNNGKANTQATPLPGPFQNTSQPSRSFFRKNVGATEFYIFTYKCEMFIIIAGETYIFSGWSEKIKERLNSFINDANNQIESINLTDHTYSNLPEGKIPRRLRSLGGGLRRIFSLIKENDNKLKNKDIIKDLKYSTLFGDQEKIKSQISAVEKNAKNSYKENQQPLYRDTDRQR